MKKQLVRLQIRAKHSSEPAEQSKSQVTFVPHSRWRRGTGLHLSQGTRMLYPKVILEKYLLTQMMMMMSVLWWLTTQGSRASVTIQVLWPSSSIQHQSPFILAKEPKSSNPRPQHHLHYFFKQYYLLKLGLNITVHSLIHLIIALPITCWGSNNKLNTINLALTRFK